MGQPKKTVFERAAQTFDLPADVLAGLPRVEIIGCREVYIENHRGILEYGEQEITVNGGAVVVRVRGSGLGLRSMSANELTMSGTVSSLEFVF